MMVCGALEEKQHICTSSLLQNYELLYRPPNFEHCFIVLHLVNQSSPRLRLSQKPLNRYLDKGTAESLIATKSNNSTQTKSGSSEIPTNHSIFILRKNEEMSHACQD